MAPQLSKAEILRLLELLNQELAAHDIRGEVYLVGGAVMCLVFGARASTRDVDALFRPAQRVREAARRVALQAGAAENWLNDAAKGYLSDHGAFDDYLELSHLRLLTAQPAYLLAMKCLAARIGEEFHDVADIRYLLRDLNLTAYQDALRVITQYYPLERFPQKTLYLLEELLGTGEIVAD